MRPLFEDGPGEPARSFDTLMEGLRTLAKNEMKAQASEVTFDKYTRSTPLQDKAFEWLGVRYRM